MPYKNREEYNRYMRNYRKQKQKQYTALEQKNVKLAEALTISFMMNLDKENKK